jgi:hypothetical protein
MSTATLLTLLLPYLPDLLEFLTGRLDHFGRANPAPAEKSEDLLILDTVRDIVEAVGQAHPDWTDDEKRRTATSAIRAHLEKNGIALTDSQANVLVELYASRAASRRKDPD